MAQRAYPIRRLASRVWGSARQLWLLDERDAIWHSTYYSLPGVWNGPQVVTVNDLIHEQFPQLFDDAVDDIARQRKRRSIEQASAVICVSETTRQQVKRFYPLGGLRLWVIPNACSPAFHPLQPPIETFQPTAWTFLIRR